MSCGLAMQALGDANAYLCAVLLDPDNDVETPAMLKKTNGQRRPQARRVRVDELTTDEETFQPRFGGLRANHVATLADLLRRGIELDPPEVWEHPETKALIIADGHHRLAAHQEVNPGGRIKVRVHRCEMREALELPLRENTKERLTLTHDEKADRAWAWTDPDQDRSKRETAQLCGVSERTVANMRRVRKELVDRGEAPPRSWTAARMLYAGAKPKELTDDERAAWVEEQVAKADSAFGAGVTDLIQRCPEAAAAFLERCAGGRLSGLLEWIDYFECEVNELTGEVIPKAHADDETPFGAD